MRERDRLSLKQFRREFEAEERRKKEEAERPAKEAIRTWEENVKKLAQAHRDRVANSEDHFDAIYDEDTWGLSLDVEATRQFNLHTFGQFVEKHPEAKAIFQHGPNFDALCQYFERNNIRIVSLKSYENAYRILTEHGLIEHPAETAAREEARRKAAEPIIAPGSVKGYELHADGTVTSASRWYSPAEQSGMNSELYRNTIAQYELDHPTPVTAKPQGPEMVEGVDWRTGLPLRLTSRQVAALSSEEYKRFMGLRPEDRDLGRILKRL